MTATEYDIMERLERIERLLAIVVGAPQPPIPVPKAKPRPGSLKARIATVLEVRDYKRAQRSAQA